MESQLYLDGKCIVGVVNAEDMKAYDVLPKHLDGIVNQLRVTKDVELAVFLYETEDAGYKISLRSNGRVNVAEIAMTFGGGGHIMAAGANLNGSVDEIIGKVCTEVKKQL